VNCFIFICDNPNQPSGASQPAEGGILTRDTGSIIMGPDRAVNRADGGGRWRHALGKFEEKQSLEESQV